MALLCAANQISKSSTQIRKVIHWATATERWAEWWPTKPLQFWYLYPTKEVASIEFDKKWVEEFLPRGEYKDHPKYGWHSEKRDRFVWALHFNSGVTIYFKTYAQNIQHLQSGTVHYIACDEELPEELYDELTFRTTAVSGYFSMVFTATLGQEMWREAMEEKGKNEKFPDAWKKQIAMYDCQKYVDGTKSLWTNEKIAGVKARCKNEAEIQRRVHGKFVIDEDRKYPTFDPSRHYRSGHPLPKTWHIYAGVDIGSGGAKGHPSAICFIGVSPDFKQGRVFLGWRGDGITTTAGDVLIKFQSLRGDYKLTQQFYDQGCKDFFTIATRVSEPFSPAEKGHEIGENIINTLFRHNMMVVYESEELAKLKNEFLFLRKATAKRSAKDDFTDAFRYAVTKIPWDFSHLSIIKDVTPQKKTAKELEIEARRGIMQGVEDQEKLLIEDEIDEWNDLYEN